MSVKLCLCLVSDFSSILDFLYLGEANVYQEDLDSFLVIAEEIQLKGLTKQSSKDLIQDEEETRHADPIQKGIDLPKKLATPHLDLKRNGKISSRTSTTVAVSNQLNTDLQALDEKVKSMMEKGQQMIPARMRANGTLMQEKMWICKVCAKEGRWHIIKDHIEAHHLEGVCIPCDKDVFCKE